MYTKCIVASFGIAALCGSVAFAATATDAKPGQGEMQLPPGWTMEDMQAVMEAGTPGKMHEYLSKDIGTWDCETTMWMVPDSEPMTGKGTCTCSPLMEGRYVKSDMKGGFPGMGPYLGMGIAGYDNVSKEFVSNWLDNQGTGIMNGVGKLSADGKTLTWEYSGNCPVTKQPIVMREVETRTGPNTKTMEMFGDDPKTGKEFKMMRIELTRQ